MKESQDLIREAQRLYKKDWRAKNKEKIKKSNERYWLKKAQQMGLADNASEEVDTNVEHS